MRGVRRLTDLLVFVGPSGCGKSTIIEKLSLEFPSAFGFSISHTTRPPRQGEVRGKDYHFVSKAKFKSMLAENAFIEYTELRTSSASASAPDDAAAEESTISYYGTSKEALNEVLIQNRVVLMDTDVLGAINIRRYCEGKLSPVAPRASRTGDADNGATVAGLPAWRPTRSTTEPQENQDRRDVLRSLSCKVIFIAPPSAVELVRRLKARQSETEETLQRRVELGEQWMAWANANRDFFDHRIVNDDLETCYAAVRSIVLKDVVAIPSAL